MTPTEALKHEHQVILLVLEAADRAAQEMKQAGKLDADRVGKMIEFFRNFADRCHHAKEENLLFQKMQARGVSRDTGPIAVMLGEHEEGRRRVAALAEALPRAESGDAAAVSTVSQNLSAYVELLRTHIEKEDGVLYPMADRMLSAEDQNELEAEFERVEAEEMGEGVHERYHELAHELAEG